MRVELVCDCWSNRAYVITCGESLLSIQVQVEPKGHCIERALCHDLHSRAKQICRRWMSTRGLADNLRGKSGNIDVAAAI